MAREEFYLDLPDVRLATWLYRPAAAGSHPLIVMSHGLGAVKEMGLDHYAEIFRDAGFACLVYDHRNCGGSSGEPRFEYDPWRQVNDMRDVITLAVNLPGIERERIGLWGTSWSGGHVLVVGATDPRVKCIVAQVPTISGFDNSQRAMPAEKMSAFFAEFGPERARRLKGGAPTYVRISGEGSDGDQWSTEAGRDTPYSKQMTLMTRELRLAYEPGVYVRRIGPKPLMMIVASGDVRTPVDLQLAAYETALEPKRLLIVDGHHYSVYTDRLAEAAQAAADWFSIHLSLKS